MLQTITLFRLTFCSKTINTLNKTITKLLFRQAKKIEDTPFREHSQGLNLNNKNNKVWVNMNVKSPSNCSTALQQKISKSMSV